MAWDDMVAVNAIDEFCNVVILRCHRKIAEEVLAMRGKSSTEPVKPDGKKTGNDKGVYSVNNYRYEQKRSGCFRCGFIHKVKDCRHPAT